MSPHCAPPPFPFPLAGSASNLVPTRLSGLPVAPVAALCTVCTLLAGHTFTAALAATRWVLAQAAGETPAAAAWWARVAWPRALLLAQRVFNTHAVYALVLPFTAGTLSRLAIQGLLGKVRRSTPSAYPFAFARRHASRHARLMCARPPAPARRGVWPSPAHTARTKARARGPHQERAHSSLPARRCGRARRRA